MICSADVFRHLRRPTLVKELGLAEQEVWVSAHSEPKPLHHFYPQAAVTDRRDHEAPFEPDSLEFQKERMEGRQERPECLESQSGAFLDLREEQILPRVQRLLGYP